MIPSLFIVFEKVLDFYCVKQLSAFSAWLARNSLEENSTVLIYLPYQERFLRNGRRVRKPDYAEIDFILCKPGKLDEAFKEMDLIKKTPWKNIFSSSELEIWENSYRYHSTVPTRFGLGIHQKEEILNFSRKVLYGYLKKENISDIGSSFLQDNFSHERVDLDIGLWVDGELRGSIIVQDMLLVDAIKQGVCRSARDVRFKPLTLNDMSNLRIEISLISQLRIPLTRKELHKNEIYHEKTYMMSVRGKNGWYLPMAFNALKFKDLKDLLTRLLTEKVGIKEEYYDDALTKISETENFIEERNGGGGVLSMNGPVALSSPSLLHGRERLKALFDCANKGANLFTRIQENDGTIPTVISPLVGVVRNIDWPRMALAAWSVAYWWKVDKSNTDYEKVARKSFLYLKENAFDLAGLSSQTHCMTLLYYRKLASVLNENEEVIKSNDKIIELIPLLEYEPILYSQIAVHFLDIHPENGMYLEKAVNFTQSVLMDYEKKIASDNAIELAGYPELIYLLSEIGKRTKNTDFIKKSEEIKYWFISKQKKDGSFLGRTNSNFSYMRGTGKIFEVLSIAQDVYADYMENVITWIISMQYTQENSFFVREAFKQKIIGGFRHDYLNYDSWSDSVAHVLIGAARLKERKIILQ